MDEEDFKKIMNSDMLSVVQSERQYRQRKLVKQST